MKLKDKIKNWLFKEELDDIKETKEKYDELLRSVERAQATTHKAQEMHDKSHALLEDCRKLMNSICDVGTDIGFKNSDHSWAVICIHGKMDYVKFVDMNQRDIRSIADFLKNFEYSNRVIDSPLYYRKAFEDLILKW
jgi:hypothetical protein